MPGGKCRSFLQALLYRLPIIYETYYLLKLVIVLPLLILRVLWDNRDNLWTTIKGRFL